MFQQRGKPIQIPTDKIGAYHRKSNKVVLSLSGSFNPPHIDHVKMMEEAKHEAESKGYVVVGGYLSPSSDRYVQGKKNDMAAPLDLRYRMCVEAVRSSDWLMATCLGLPSQRRTAGAIGKVTRLKVIIVMGSDVAERFDDRSKGIIVVQRKSLLSSSRIIDHSRRGQWEAVQYDMDAKAYQLWRPFVEQVLAKKAATKIKAVP